MRESHGQALMTPCKLTLTTMEKSTSSPAVSLLAVTVSLSPLTTALDLTSALSVPLALHDAGLL